jgi:hypothetical protein
MRLGPRADKTADKRAPRFECRVGKNRIRPATSDVIGLGSGHATSMICLCFQWLECDGPTWIAIKRPKTIHLVHAYFTCAQPPHFKQHIGAEQAGRRARIAEMFLTEPRMRVKTPGVESSGLPIGEGQRFSEYRWRKAQTYARRASSHC